MAGDTIRFLSMTKDVYKRQDLLILLSDIDGLFTDDPNTNPDAEFIDTVEVLDEKLLSMGKGPKSKVGTGGMATKLTAAEIATAAGADMVIANGRDFHVIHKIMDCLLYTSEWSREASWKGRYAVLSAGISETGQTAGGFCIR